MYNYWPVIPMSGLCFSHVGCGGALKCQVYRLTHPIWPGWKWVLLGLYLGQKGELALYPNHKITIYYRLSCELKIPRGHAWDSQVTDKVWWGWCVWVDNKPKKWGFLVLDVMTGHLHHIYKLSINFFFHKGTVN